MSDNKPLNDWVKDFEALQRQYLGAWSDLMQKVPGGVSPPPFSTPFGAPPPPPFATPFGTVPGMFGGAFGAPPAPAPGWHEGLEQWSRMFGVKGGAGDTMERMIESSKAYIGMIKSMLGGANIAGMGDGANPAQAWLDALRGGIGGMPGFQMPGMDGMSGFQMPGMGGMPGFQMPGMDGMSGFQMPGIDAMSANPFFKAISDIAGRGAKGLADLPASFAPFLEQFGEQFRQQNMSWLRMPAFGLAREHQEHYQRTAIAFVEYQEASRGYNALLLKASQRGLELMESKLAERSEPGRVIDSPRALYDLWVDAAEEAYAEVALSDEFGKAYGELANAQMRMRAQIQAEVERVGTDLGMPTRSELDSVHQRLHDLRREFRDRGEGSTAIVDLEAEVAALRDEVERLKSAAESERLDANALRMKTGAAPRAPAQTRTRRARRANNASARQAGANKTSVNKPSEITPGANKPSGDSTTGKSGAKRAKANKTAAKTTRATKANESGAKGTSANAISTRKNGVSQVATGKAGSKPPIAKKRKAKPAAAKATRAAQEAAAPVASMSARATSVERKADARKAAVTDVFAPSTATLAASASARPVPPKSKSRRADRRARAKVPAAPRDAARVPAPSSFGDAIAAMRKRVARSSKSGHLKSVAAQFVGPYKSAVAKSKRPVGARGESSKIKGKS